MSQVITTIRDSKATAGPYEALFNQYVDGPIAMKVLKGNLERNHYAAIWHSENEDCDCHYNIRMGSEEECRATYNVAVQDAADFEANDEPSNTFTGFCSLIPCNVLLRFLNEYERR